MRIKFGGNYIWASAGNIFYAVCQWLILLAIVKLGSPYLVGQYSLGVAITGPVIVIFNFSLRMVQATDTKRRYSFGEYMQVRVVTTVLAIAAMAGVAFVSGYETAAFAIIMIIGLARSFEAISELYYSYFQMQERMDLVSKSLILRGGLCLICLSAAVYFTNSVFWGGVSLAAACLFTLFAYDKKHRTRLRAASEPAVEAASKKAKYGRLMEIVKIAFPLGIASIMTTINYSIPRYSIESYLGTHELGIFTAIAYFMLLNSIPMNAIGQAASTKLSKSYMDDPPRFKKLLVMLAAGGLAFGLASIAVALVFGGGLLNMLYGEEYARYSHVFVWLMVAACIGNVECLLWYGATSARLFKVQAPLFAVFSALTVAACMLAVPAYGLTGAAVAIALVTGLQLLAAFSVIVYALKKRSSASGRQLRLAGAVEAGK